jgi:hypothetical protein
MPLSKEKLTFPQIKQKKQVMMAGGAIALGAPKLEEEEPREKNPTTLYSQFTPAGK